MSKVQRRAILALILLVVIGAGILIYGTGALDYLPRLRASAKSPDGEFTVLVYQKRLEPRPFFPRMGAIAKIYDKQGRLVYENIVFRDSDWDDTVGDAFKEVSFEPNEIRIGPGFYDRSQVYVIKKSDLKTRQ